MPQPYTMQSPPHFKPAASYFSSTPAHPVHSSYPSAYPPQEIYPWDLKGQPGLPPKGHWALYKGEIVSDAYLANNAYGHACAAAGFSIEFSLISAQTFSLKSLHEPDQPEDEAAIRSGWNEEHTGNPWPKDLSSPTDYEILKHRHPFIYELKRLSFQQ